MKHRYQTTLYFTRNTNSRPDTLRIRGTPLVQRFGSGRIDLSAGADRFWASCFRSDNAHVLVDAGQQRDRLFLDFFRSTGAEVDAYYGRHGRFTEWDWLSHVAVHRHLGQSSNESFAEQVFADDAASGNLLLGL